MVTFMANITRRHLICAVLPFVTALEADVAMATIRHQHVPSWNVSFQKHAETGHEVKATTSAMLAFPRRLPRPSYGVVLSERRMQNHPAEGRASG